MCGPSARRTSLRAGTPYGAAFFLAPFALIGSACGGAESPPRAPAPPAAVATEPPPAAPAVEAPRDVSLRYSAAAECPDVEGYLAHVRLRARRLNVVPEPVAGAADAVVVEVAPELEPAGWRGRVTISGERALEREVRGERCADVVAALALITVLRLEGEGGDANAAVSPTVSPAVSPAGAAGTEDADPAPNAAAAGETAPAPAPAPPPETAPNVAAATPDSVPEPPAAAPGAAAAPEVEPDDAPAAEALPDDEMPPPPEPPPREPSAPAPASEEPPLPEPLEPEPFVAPSSEAEPDGDAEPEAADVVAEPEPPGEPWSWPASSVGVAAYAGYASVPGHALKGTLETELRLGEDVSSWAALLSLAYARGNSPVPSGELGLTLLSAQLGLCPPAFIAEASLWLRACASVRAGALRSTVSSTDPTFRAEFDQKWRPWLALGPTLQVGVPLGDRITLRGLAELTVQLVRDRYSAEQLVEETETLEPFVVYEPEAISLELGVGIGYSF